MAHLKTAMELRPPRSENAIVGCEDTGNQHPTATCKRPTLTLLTCTNKENSRRGEKLLKHEASKISFLNPKLVLIDSIESLNEYNRFCIQDLADYFTTDFCLKIEFDSTILNPAAWDDVFFKYDYIGGPWTKKHVSCNSGFAMWSKKICEFLKHNSKDYRYGREQDQYICCDKYDTLIKNGIKIAPYETAKRFSVECGIYENSFGAHHWYIKDEIKHNLKTTPHI